MSTSHHPKRVVIYARISVSNDESVSIARQVESCRKLAEARGWEVVQVIEDDGLSATHNKPEDRRGWRDLLGMHERYDAVLIWKVDRLARRTLDFLHAHEALQERGAAVVCVEQPIDMTTATGRAFATMMAVFAEMEADAISSRVAAARTFLLKSGRLVGGTVPYGFKSVPNPDGAGYVLAQDENTVSYVRGAVGRALAGHSIYSIQRWLDATGAPLPTASQKARKRTGWHYSTVERMLRSPVLAGMTSFNPGNGGKERGTDVLRDENGMPVIDESVAIISTDERRKLLALLDNRDSPQAKPRASKQVTPSLLSGLVTCGHCDRRMHRGTNVGRPVLSCPQCHQTITMTQLTPYVERKLLTERGEWSAWETVLVGKDDAATLADVEEAIRDVTAKLAHDDADLGSLLGQLEALKEQRARARSTTSVRKRILRFSGTIRQQWESAVDDEARRSVLAEQLRSLVIVRGKTGRYFDPNRVRLAWVPAPVESDSDGDLDLVR